MLISVDSGLLSSRLTKFEKLIWMDEPAWMLYRNLLQVIWVNAMSQEQLTGCGEVPPTLIVVDKTELVAKEKI